MTTEAIDKIRNAEKAAEATVDAAEKKAAAMLEKADRDAAEIIAAAQRRGEERISEVLADARAKAEKTSAAGGEHIHDALSALDKAKDERMPEAFRLIREKLISKQER